MVTLVVILSSSAKELESNKTADPVAEITVLTHRFTACRFGNPIASIYFSMDSMQSHQRKCTHTKLARMSTWFCSCTGKRTR